MWPYYKRVRKYNRFKKQNKKGFQFRGYSKQRRYQKTQRLALPRRLLPKGSYSTSQPEKGRPGFFYSALQSAAKRIVTGAMLAAIYGSGRAMAHTAEAHLPGA